MCVYIYIYRERFFFFSFFLFENTTHNDESCASPVFTSGVRGHYAQTLYFWLILPLIIEIKGRVHSKLKFHPSQLTPVWWCFLIRITALLFHRWNEFHPFAAKYCKCKQTVDKHNMSPYSSSGGI